jgi:hypothetical protein
MVVQHNRLEVGTGFDTGCLHDHGTHQSYSSGTHPWFLVVAAVGPRTLDSPHFVPSCLAGSRNRLELRLRIVPRNHMHSLPHHGVDPSGRAVDHKRVAGLYAILGMPGGMDASPALAMMSLPVAAGVGAP